MAEAEEELKTFDKDEKTKNENKIKDLYKALRTENNRETKEEILVQLRELQKIEAKRMEEYRKQQAERMAAYRKQQEERAEAEKKRLIELELQKLVISITLKLLN